MDVKAIQINDYDYTLADDKIAKYPLAQRDQSKLLVYDGQIRSDSFRHVGAYLNEGSLLFVNNSKVIPARLLFMNSTGARIEIFCLEPANNIPHSISLSTQHKVQWHCMIGNLKKWREDNLQIQLRNNAVEFKLQAKFIDPAKQIVEFNWDADLSFAEILMQAGAIPLPPYLNREADESDKTNYQTVYAKYEGSVAAPTAGLHFTEEVFQELAQKNIKRSELCLHVGAGTFKPVKSEQIGEHQMHEEVCEVQLEHIQQLITQIENQLPVVAVGTTSARTLESLYYIGQMVEKTPTTQQLHVDQWQAYTNHANISAMDALQNILGYLQVKQLNKLNFTTQLLIAPGYQFKLISQLVTNFHQPKSTLLLLIAAICGDNWKKIYDYALNNDFRFLSYGDSSLLIIPDDKIFKLNH